MLDFLKKILDSLEFYILAGVLFVVMWYFVLSPRKIDGISMQQYLQHNDYILIYKLEYLYSRPQRGDIVVFKHSATQDYIKRVIGLPNETILVQNGKVYINGTLLDETAYLDSTVLTQPEAVIHEGIPYTIPDGQYVLMGDNRPQSTDSREFGAVSREYIEGRAILVWYPFENMKLIKRQTYKLTEGNLENFISTYAG